LYKSCMSLISVMHFSHLSTTLSFWNDWWHPAALLADTTTWLHLGGNFGAWVWASNAKVHTLSEIDSMTESQVWIS
jgi:hypothetical protein